MPRPKSNRETEGIRRMVHLHLRRRAKTAPSIAPDQHLDDDLLSSFTEGRLNENESAPVVKHLIACSFCRHITAQLIRLDSEVGESKVTIPVTPEDPGRIRRMLEDLGSRVFAPSDDEAVFAYHAPAEDFEKERSKNVDEDDEGTSDAPVDSKA